MSDYMRLLDVDEHGELSLTKHLPGQIPPYAILSHTWGADRDEVVYEDIQDNTWRNKKGQVKIEFCIERVRQHRLRHFWIDTCCIDKNNGKELEFAITSMFRWYAESDVCFVFLSDVSYYKRSHDGSHDPWRSVFRRARWFTRGWTLQELLAPKSVEFYSREGSLLGNKTTLEQDIHEITCISPRALCGATLSTFTPEERMSWAKNRQTTREEDEAYCLSGIFEVYIIPHYGEKQNAFVRLKREIAKAWGEQIMTIQSPMKSQDSILDSRSPERPHSTKQSSIISDHRSVLLESLGFDQMDSRQESLKHAYRSTCEWFLSHPHYVDWAETHTLHEHNGFLWLSGNPGVGKSTLMKFALAHAKKARLDNDLILAFFFNARGEALERSTLGMYRAIMWHLFKQAPDLQKLLDDIDTQTWTVDALTRLLFAAVAKLGHRRLRCFIDALDECGEKQVRQMITSMEDLSKYATQLGVQFAICFASRHYPTISIRYGRQVVLEAEPGHGEDIAKYIRSHLSGGKGRAVEGIKAELQKKANGVFLWVVLVIEILNETLTRGLVKEAKKALDDIPQELGKLFRRIILRDQVRLPDLLLSLQLVSFAARPLTNQEFYHAMEGWHDTDAASPEALDLSEITEEHMMWRVSSSTKGLAGLTKSQKPTVQFIHESVRDYLIRSNGLHELWPEISHNLPQVSHNRLKQCCAKHLQADLSAFTEQNRPLPEAESEKGRRLRENVTRSFPFLDYASKYIWFHAEKAQSHHRPQMEFLLSFHLHQWINVSNILQVNSTRRLTANASLLYILAENRHPKLIETLPYEEFTKQDQLERHRHPIFTAIASDSETTVLALLNRWKSYSIVEPPSLGRARVDFSFIRKPNKDGHTVLYLASEKGWKETAQLLLSNGGEIEARKKGGHTSLGVSSMKGHTQLVQMLLTAGADVNAQGGHYGNALQAAAALGRQEVVQMLLTAGADVNAQGGQYGNALQAAAARGRQEVVQMLLTAGADVNAQVAGADVNTQGCQYRNALQAAAARGRQEVVQMLLTAGANVNAQGGQYGNALQAAAALGRQEVVQMLLMASADVNAQGGRYGNALQAAAALGRQEVVQMLLTAGADVNAQGGWYGNALQAAAATRGRQEVVQVLLTAGADVNAQGGQYGNALQAAAATRGRQEVVQVLLTAGADVNAQGGWYGNALQAAAALGRQEVVQMLLTAGANVNAQGGQYGNALQAAATRGRQEVVQMLLTAGADVNAQEGRYGNVL